MPLIPAVRRQRLISQDQAGQQSKFSSPEGQSATEYAWFTFQIMDLCAENHNKPIFLPAIPNHYKHKDYFTHEYYRQL